MEISFTFSVFVKLLSIILGLLSAIILWVYPKKGGSPNRLLSTSFLFLSVALIWSFIIESGLILKVPHAYRLGNLFALLFMPLSYLYMRSVIHQTKLQKGDLIHIIFPLIYILDYLPFYLLSAGEKRLLLEQDLMNLNYLLSYDQGWLMPAGFHLVFRQLTWVFYWVLQVRLLSQVRIYLPGVDKENRSWLRWAQIITGFQFFFFLPYFIFLLFDTIQYNWVTTTTIIAVFFVFILIYMFLRPDILYGLKELTYVSTAGETGQEEVNHTNLQYISQEEVDEIMQMVESLMNEKSYYLQHGFTLQDLANETQIPYHRLSSIINRETQLHFNEYLNRHRIQHCITNMQRGEWEKFTLEALAYECGFNNRNTFTLSFKKFKGLTPSAYFKQMK